MPSSLKGVLDREVYAAVGKFVDKTGASLREISVEDVYAYISRSNSTLARKSKVLLLDSISRVLEVMKAEMNDDDSDESGESAAANDGARPADSSNAMNQLVTASLRIATAESRREDLQHTPRPAKRASKHGDLASTSKRSLKKARVAAAAAVPSTSLPAVPLESISGLDKQIDTLLHKLFIPFNSPEVYIENGVPINHGFLLHGPSGCGKTMLCEAYGNLLKVPFIRISASSVASGISGDSEKAIREQFDMAIKCAPSLIFIDEIDSMFSKRESTQREMERRMVSTLGTCIDDLDLAKTDGKPVMVLATATRPDSLDPALRRAGRFGLEIEIGVPDANARTEILKSMTHSMKCTEDVDLAEIARHTHGFVGADLRNLVHESLNFSMARFAKWWKEAAFAARDTEMDDGTLSAGTVPTAAATTVAMRDFRDSRPNFKSEANGIGSGTTLADFRAAVSTIKASSTREGFTSVPDVPWDTVGAYHEIRQLLLGDIVNAILEPATYSHLGISPPGVLLHGPPGCGKTLLAKAVASAANANLITVKGPELLSKYVGESEKAIRQLFARARTSQPVIIFFDEIDALVPRRDDSDNSVVKRLVNVMLAEIDGFDPLQGVHIMAATNRLDAIDPALLRPGRLGKSLYVGLPTAEERVEILGTVLRRHAVREAERLEIARVGAVCEGFSGADLENLVYEAGMVTMRRCQAAQVPVKDMFIAADDVRQALVRVKASV